MLPGMKTRIVVAAGGAALLLGWYLPAHAADDAHCIDVKDSAQRLACYDSANGRSERPAAKPAQTKPVATPAPAAMPPAPKSAAAEKAKAPQQAKAKRSDAEPSEAAVSATVTKVTHTRDERFVATLENGQVWAQVEKDSAADVAVGDNVTIRKALMGSHLMQTRGGTTRVKLRE